MYEPHKVAYRHPKYKTAYRVKNWPEYEKSLRDRGDITIWFSQEAIEAWTPKKNGKRGGQPVYSNIAIETSLSLRLIFQLPLRQTEGFLGSLLRLMRLDLPCPDHTTLSRRNQTIDVQRNIDKLPDGPVCLIVDSTGLKMHGGNGWHEEKHRAKKARKTWRKLHIALDPDTGDILAAELTTEHVGDETALPCAFRRIRPPIPTASAHSYRAIRPPVTRCVEA